MKWVGFFAAALVLGGCNMITTETPMFTAADSGAPALREGVWLIDDPECVVDDRKSPDTWPDCASWMVVEGGRMKFPGGTAETGLTADELPFVLTGGDPRVWQLTLALPKTDKQMNFYLGFQAIEVGGDGKVIRYRSWPAQCGPVPPKPAGETQNADDLVTREPFAGLSMREDGSCAPLDEEALRDGVARSRLLDPERPKDEGRWVRPYRP